MKIKKVFCFFEQSGTFKNAFKALGVDAEDYDILNDFGETDHQIDLFSEIDKAYSGEPSLFDEIGEDDLCLAFFPCTRFQAYNCANFQGKNYGMKEWNDVQKLENSIELHKQLHYLYVLICKLFLISIQRNIRLIVENPYTQPHYLTWFFPVEPKIIIRDRSEEGDYYTKPTQFFFVNCTPEQNVVMTPIKMVEKARIESLTNMKIGKSWQVMRSLMHPQFADRFIKTYILDKDGGVWMD